MPTGLPDFGRAAAAGAVHTVADQAELAARTGSINTFHRGGNVLWSDDFEAATINWLPTTSGTGSSVTLSTTERRNGAQALLLTGGSDLSRLAQIGKTWGPPSGDQVGFEFSFITTTIPSFIRLRISFFDGTNQTNFQVMIDYDSAIVSVLNSAGGQTTVVDPLALGIDPNPINTFKLVVNQSTGNYVRLFLNNRTADLSEIAGEQSASASNPVLQAFIRLVSTPADNDTAFIDDFILTHQEP